MILPNKYVTLEESLFGISLLFIELLKTNKMTVDKLIDRFNKKYIKTDKLYAKPTYQKLVYVIEFMYMIDMISYNENGEIYKNENFKFKDI